MACLGSGFYICFRLVLLFFWFFKMVIGRAIFFMRFPLLETLRWWHLEAFFGHTTKVVTEKTRHGY